MGIPLDNERFQTGINLHLFHYLFHVSAGSKILARKSIPKACGGCIGHVILLQSPTLVIETAAQIHHANVEHRIAVTEIPEVNEILLAHSVFFYENTIGELQVTVDSCVCIRRCSDKIVYFLLTLKSI